MDKSTCLQSQLEVAQAEIIRLKEQLSKEIKEAFAEGWVIRCNYEQAPPGLKDSPVAKKKFKIWEVKKGLESWNHSNAKRKLEQWITQ